MDTQTSVLDESGVELERVMEAGRDALTDDIVTRLAATSADALGLIDRFNRSGVGNAIPVLAELVNNGDLERLVQLARVVGSAQDALTDDIVGRLGETLASSLDLMDRFNRGSGHKVVGMLDRLDASGSMERMAAELPQFLECLYSLQHMSESLRGAISEAREAPPAAGGIGGIWRMLSDRENQETLRFFLALGKRLRNEGQPGT